MENYLIISSARNAWGKKKLVRYLNKSSVGSNIFIS